MNEYAPAHGMQRILLLLLAFAFAGMTATSLWQRIMRPELVVPSNIPQRSSQQGEAHTGDMHEIAELMKKIQRDPGDVATMIHLAEHFVEDKNWTAAESFSRKAVVAAPGNPQPLYLLGVILHNQGNHAEAAACLERVVILRDEPFVRYSLGVLYIHYLQNPTLGSQHLRAALAQSGVPDGLTKSIRAELDALVLQTVPSKETDAPTKTAPERKNAKPIPAH